MSFLGVEMSDIEEITLPAGNWLNKPLSEISMGQFVKVVIETMSTSNQKIRNHITKIEETLKKNKEENKSIKDGNEKLNQKKSK